MVLACCAPVLASSRHGTWSGRGGTRPSPSYQANTSAPRRLPHAGAALPGHPRPTKAHVVRHPRQAAVPTHRGLVPLANTTWDNPQMPPAVASAIQAAASAADVDPHLLLALAWRESRFDPVALNGRSSARGLMQFTAGTWLQAVEKFGAGHQASTYAGTISKDAQGRLLVPDEQNRAAILQLRSDPVLSAALAANILRQYREAMKERLGREVTLTDLYLLHVLGPTGAFRFLEAVAQRPRVSSQSVASLHTLRNAGLLARDGRPLTVADTYAAVRAMLAEQRRHSDQLLSTALPEHRAAPGLIEVSETH